MSDNNDIYFKVNNSSDNNVIWNDTTSYTLSNYYNNTSNYKIETAEDHPLIKTLDKILGLLIRIVDKSSDWITNLELKIITKRKKKDKKKFIRKFFNHKKN